MFWEALLLGIKQIIFARTGTDFIVSSGDRIIRVYNLEEVMLRGVTGNGKPEPEPVQKLQDMVNRTAWKKVKWPGHECISYFFIFRPHKHGRKIIKSLRAFFTHTFQLHDFQREKF